MRHRRNGASNGGRPPFSSMAAYERVLADNIRDVVGDIRLADAEILISYAVRQLHGNMNDLVASSTELFFKDRTLTYARAADVNLDWSSTPSLVLDMEFCHGPVIVSFKLVLGDRQASVLINQMLLNDRFSAHWFNGAEFDKVLNSARLRPTPVAAMHHFTHPHNATRQ